MSKEEREQAELDAQLPVRELFEFRKSDPERYRRASEVLSEWYPNLWKDQLPHFDVSKLIKVATENINLGKIVSFSKPQVPKFDTLLHCKGCNCSKS